MKRNYKILEGGVQPLGQLSDADINILYNQYIKLDGKHKNFKGTKREYCSTVAGLIDKFLKGSNSTLEGSGKLEKSIDFYKPRVLKLLPQADRIAANAAIETIENDATLSKYAQRANIIRLLKIAYQNKPAVDATGKLVPDIKNLNANLDKLLSDLNKKENLISGTVSNLIKFNVLKDAAGNVVKDAAGNPVSAKTITIPKVKHNNKTGIYKTADIPQVISEKIFNKSATDKATDVTLPRLLAYASEFKNVIKAFANNDLATAKVLNFYTENGEYSYVNSSIGVLAGTSGILQDDSDLTFSGATLTTTNLVISTAITTVGGVAPAVLYWRSTSAISSINLFDSANSWDAETTATLYGIKAV